MKTKTMVIATLFITALTHVESLWSLSNLINQSINTENNMQDNWIFHIISLVSVFTVVYYLLYKYEKIKQEMTVFNILSHYRNKNIFMNQFKDYKYLRLPDESDEELFNRMPQGQYLDELKQEYKSVKQMVINKLDINPSQASKLLDSAYGIKRKTKKQ